MAYPAAGRQLAHDPSLLSGDRFGATLGSGLVAGPVQVAGTIASPAPQPHL
jgi:hypothetical protein